MDMIGDLHDRRATSTRCGGPARGRRVAHEGGFAVPGELVVASPRHGDLSRARHAANLRPPLPLGGAVRTGVERRIGSLDARLN